MAEYLTPGYKSAFVGARWILRLSLCLKPHSSSVQFTCTLDRSSGKANFNKLWQTLANYSLFSSLPKIRFAKVCLTTPPPGQQNLGTVQILRGIFQGDSISPFSSSLVSFRCHSYSEENLRPFFLLSSNLASTSIWSLELTFDK